MQTKQNFKCSKDVDPGIPVDAIHMIITVIMPMKVRIAECAVTRLKNKVREWVVVSVLDQININPTMKNKILLLALIPLLFACNQTQQKREKTTQSQNLSAPEGSYGEIITTDSAINAEELIAKMETSDSLFIKLNGEIAACCQHSGCWMEIDLNDSTTLKVTFKDYAFVIPTNSKGKRAWIEGYATKGIIPVETLRNYAVEDGKSAEEINRITKPEVEYTFEAKGVLLKDNH